MNNHFKMKIIFLSLLIVLIPFFSIAFEMPIDPLTIDYQSFLKETEPILEGENLVFTKSFDYYNNTFSYSIYFNKNNLEDWYIFFKSPEKIVNFSEFYKAEMDNFYEFYKDVIYYFLDLSYMTIRDIDYSKDLIETDTHFFLTTSEYFDVYKKVYIKEGFYGFGIIKSILEEDFNEKIDVVNNYWGYFNIYLYDKKDFNPEGYSKDTVYIDPSILPGSIEKDLKYNSNDLYDCMFFHQWVLRSINNKNIKLKIEVDNIENLKSCILFDNYANLHVMNDFINREIEIPYSDNHIEHFAFIGKLVEGDNKKVVFQIKASCK